MITILTKEKIWKVPNNFYDCILENFNFFTTLQNFNDTLENIKDINISYIEDKNFQYLLQFVKYYLRNPDDLSILFNDKYAAFNKPENFNQLLSFMLFLDFAECKNNRLLDYTEEKYFEILKKI